jgi:hypothetical protein
MMENRAMRLSLCILLTMLPAGSAFAQGHATQSPPYLGRWYIEDPAVCKGPAGDTEGLLVYGRKTVEGHEYACDVVRARIKGPRTEITTRCRAEGRTTIEKEALEVVDGRLKRTIKVEGKMRTGDYKRCP